MSHGRLVAGGGVVTGVFYESRTPVAGGMKSAYLVLNFPPDPNPEDWGCTTGGSEMGVENINGTNDRNTKSCTGLTGLHIEPLTSSPVPEPSTLVLALTGVVGLIGRLRRKV